MCFYLSLSKTLGRGLSVPLAADSVEPVFAALLKIRYLPFLSSFHRSFPSLSLFRSSFLSPFFRLSPPLRSLILSVRVPLGTLSRPFRGIFRRVRSIVGRSRQSPTGREVSRGSRPRDAHSSLFPCAFLDSLFSDAQKNATRLSLYIVPRIVERIETGEPVYLFAAPGGHASSVRLDCLAAARYSPSRL